ncbi:caspase family protein [Roseimaritima sediminicola]|uniref:caspase family protein n=1 Tax=Roseimaritima sediminicola TaxID=2662066 RepID=UPI0012985205|nr:caspase family protein [Roseimaritima sediminicola]
MSSRSPSPHRNTAVQLGWGLVLGGALAIAVSIARWSAPHEVSLSATPAAATPAAATQAETKQAETKPAGATSRTKAGATGNATGERARSVADAEPTAMRHALLIGCTQYPNSPQIPELWGPANDVPAFAKLLQERFGFAENNIRQLVGWPESAARRPTYANIAAGFQHLIDVARPSSQIVILMSGHGTQLPVRAAAAGPAPAGSGALPGNQEYDGLDEVFLPADVAPSQDGSPRSALRDDELGHWLDQIRARGAAIWIVFDCCHSGTMTRSVDRGERSRGVPPQWLNVPDAHLVAAAQRAAAQRAAEQAARSGERSRGTEVPGAAGTADDAAGDTGTASTAGDAAADRRQAAQLDALDVTLDSAAGEGSLTAFYAAQAFETAPELPRPADAPRTPEHYYGLLSFMLMQTFQDQSEPLSYRELGRRVIGRYRSERGSRSPTPFFSGDLDREVLGLTTFPPPPPITFQRDGSEMLVTAGQWTGITSNTVFALYPGGSAARPEDAPLGYVRAVDIQPHRSSVAPCEFGSVAAVSFDDLPPYAVCRIAWREVGDLRLELALAADSDADRRSLDEVLQAMPPRIRSLVRTVEPAVRTQWQLRSVAPAEAWSQYGLTIREPAIVLVDSETAPQAAASATRAADVASISAPARGVYGPYPLDRVSQAAGRLAIDLQKIFTWRNTWRIAQLASAAERSRDVRGLQLHVTRKPTAARPGDGTESAPTKLVPGDDIEVRLDNRSREDMWVTLLYLSADHGIDVWLSEALAAGSTFSDQGRVDDSSLGTEGFVVLAVPVRTHRSQPNYDFLRQTGLRSHTRSVAKSAPSTPRDPVEQFMSAAAFGKPQMRALRRTTQATPQVLSWSWITVPAVQPNTSNKSSPHGE